MDKKMLIFIIMVLATLFILSFIFYKVLGRIGINIAGFLSIILCFIYYTFYNKYSN